MKTYWVSFVMYQKGKQGFGNCYIQTEEDIFVSPGVHQGLAQQFKADALVLLNYNEVANEMYDKAMAAEVTQMEKNKSN